LSKIRLQQLSDSIYLAEFIFCGAPILVVISGPKFSRNPQEILVFDFSTVVRGEWK